METNETCIDTKSLNQFLIPIKVYKENKNIKLPWYATEFAACADIYASKIEIIHNIVVVHTGLHFAVPTGWEMQIRLRSNATKHRYIMINAPGTLDSDYRGELLVKFTRIDGGFCDDFPYEVGDRIAQINVHPVPHMNFHEVDNLEDLGITERGEGGFGSTNK